MSAAKRRSLPEAGEWCSLPRREERCAYPTSGTRVHDREIVKLIHYRCRCRHRATSSERSTAISIALAAASSAHCLRAEVLTTEAQNGNSLTAFGGAHLRALGGVKPPTSDRLSQQVVARDTHRKSTLDDTGAETPALPLSGGRSRRIPDQADRAQSRQILRPPGAESDRQFVVTPETGHFAPESPTWLPISSPTSTGGYPGPSETIQDKLVLRASSRRGHPLSCSLSGSGGNDRSASRLEGAELSPHRHVI